MPYLVVRTDVRANEQNSRYAQNKRNAHETRRAIATAETYGAAVRMARALSALGQVRSGRQRIEVIPVGEP